MGVTRFKSLIAATERELRESKESARFHPKLVTLLELGQELDPIGCMCLVDLIIRNMTNPLMRFGRFDFAETLLSKLVIHLEQDEVEYLYFDERSPPVAFVGTDLIKLDAIRPSHITFLVDGHIKSLKLCNTSHATMLQDYRYGLERYVSTLVGNSDSKLLDDYRKRVIELKMKAVATAWNQDYKLMSSITEEDKTKKLMRLTRHINTLTVEKNELTREVDELGRKLMELTVTVQRMQAGQAANLEQEGQPAQAVRDVPPRSPSPHPIANFGGILLAAPSAAAASASASAAAASPAVGSSKRKIIPLASSS